MAARLKDFVIGLIWPDITVVLWYKRLFEQAFINANHHD